MPNTARRRRTHDRSREGMVMLLVLLILTMATGTATFAMHSTGYELRAAATMNRGLLARSYAQASGAAMALVLGTNPDLCGLWNSENDGGTWVPPAVSKYGFPAPVYDNREILSGLYLHDEAFKNGANAFVADSVPKPDTLRLLARDNPGPIQGTDTHGLAVFECREIQSTGTATITYRVKVTAFGEQGLSGLSQEERTRHEAVSVARVLIDRPL